VENPKDEVLERHAKQASFSIGALLGNLVGFRLPGLLREKKNTGFPFLDPEAIKILSLGAIWNFSKGTGLS